MKKVKIIALALACMVLLSVGALAVESRASDQIYRYDIVVTPMSGYINVKASVYGNGLNVCEDYLQDYNYNSNCNGVYIWSFNSQVKGEIDAGRPVILNITSGYYGNHSVVVNGYEIYEINGVEYPFIQVSDGWVYGYRYIDYNDFARSTLASFNTVSF